ncbi:MAG: hypothetical protein GY801_18390 [bacterium]|nr:hypothetical protein [bacterium]
MARYILALGVESNFYREYHKEGHSEDDLLEQLKGEITDQVGEFDLPQLVTRMLPFEGTMKVPNSVEIPCISSIDFPRLRRSGQCAVTSGQN